MRGGEASIKILPSISVVVPTLNEAGNIEPLVTRLAETLGDFAYELIFVDDHSDDGTVEQLSTLRDLYPIRVKQKDGALGKAYSLTQGFRLARHDVIVMIDGDLQYPPEAIPGMVGLLVWGEADVVVGQRRQFGAGLLRRLLHTGFRTAIGRLLWRSHVDIQSGLKAFWAASWERSQFEPKSGWTFDLEFLVRAHNSGLSIATYDIDFVRRGQGRSKLSWATAALEIGLRSLVLRLNPPVYIPFDQRTVAIQGDGFFHKGEKLVTYTKLDMSRLAHRPLSRRAIATAGLVAVSLAVALYLNWHVTLALIVAAITTILFAELTLSILTSVLGLSHEATQVSHTRRSARSWPRYTVLCPMYNEPAVVGQLIDAIRKLDYPTSQLEVFLLVEEEDAETRSALAWLDVPPHVSVLTVPDSNPRTKPKACNYGLQRASGEFLVIYDAEDVPEPDQLKKAVLVFDKAPDQVACLQAKLAYYNRDRNLLTKLFSLEYAMWYEVVLPGLQALGGPIPLGGTSNHFRTHMLRELGGWDPFNVTEDADLGVRIAEQGFETQVFESTTFEEANSSYASWIRQRSRWIKGYIVTYLMHTLRREKQPVGVKRRIVFQWIFGAKILALFINPLLWLLTIVYFAAGPPVTDLVESVYAGPLLYMGTLGLVFGNFFYLYLYMVGAAKRGIHDMIPYALLVPFYWLMMSASAGLAVRDLFVRPFHWYKTEHGRHLSQPWLGEEEPAADVRVLASR